MRSWRRVHWIMISGIALLMMISCGSPHQPNQSYHTPSLTNHKVIVLVVDSLTNEALIKASKNTKYPAIRFLMKQGHYYPRVISTFPSMTVSDVSSLLTGTYPETHRVPGLVWLDIQHHQVINYGNNFRQTMKLGPPSIIQQALFDLNHLHLSKQVQTVFEALQNKGYTTGTINLLVYRGKTQHQISLPYYLRPFAQVPTYPVLATNTFVFGELTHSHLQSKKGPFYRMGLNDDFSTTALIQIIMSHQLPDFTMVYFPDNDKVIHKYGTHDMRGIWRFEKNLERIFGSLGGGKKAISHLTLIVMGDSGVSPILHFADHPTILLKNLFYPYIIHRWGRPLRLKDDIGLTINSRMAYVYLLSNRITPSHVAARLLHDKRIDVVAWTNGKEVIVTSPEHVGSFFHFQKGGAFKDPFGVTWALHGNPAILNVSTHPHRITYGKYPDALHQLWSALHDQEGHYLVVTAKLGYQFGDESSPTHNGGAQQASMLDQDIYAPLLITGTDRLPSGPLRSVDLKNYFISLVQMNRNRK